MTTSTYRSNNNIRRKLVLTMSQPQMDALVTVFTVGEDHAEGDLINDRVRETASRAMDKLMEAWEGTAA